MNKDINVTEAGRSLGALLRRPYEDLSGRLYAELARRGYTELRVAHSPVFRYIAPQGSRVTELARRAAMTKQSMGYLVESLQAAGYLDLVDDPADGRAKLARLSKKGAQAQRTALAISSKFEQDYAALIGAANMGQLRELLELLFDRIGEGVE